MSMCLNELVMNAIEHGNLGVSYDEKQLLVEKGEYERYLKKIYLKKANNGKKIKITIGKYVDTDAGEYALVDIEDDGDGFDSSQVFKNLNFSDDMIRYHGRGIAMSQLMTDGLFYNQKGNKVTVLIINK
jgi:two-component sensor histidine kinase